ncbi:hypothetical protein [Sphingomicrobium nitratireducens]|uniref:hypothetical protein n=1 Tax=Sphingomicrobium nitratireducens TaxID=2964666 RepID=UPI0022408AC4|nr:hypothetical protein [Sphingomicrobium nitratireducens]
MPGLETILKDRDVRRLVYCHCDHFEPWRSKPRSIGPENAALVERFAEVTAALPYARRLTLFTRTHVKPVASERTGAVSLEGEPLGFLPLNAKQLEVTSPAMRALTAGGHEIQIHVHHERVTANEKYAQSSPFASYLLSPEGRARQGERFSLLTRLSLEQLRAETGEPLDRWLFVHGNWGLNGSDRNVCEIDDEILRLQALGCQGDFTFSGEPFVAHCNPDFHHPAWIVPGERQRCYSREGADARAAQAQGEDPGADRFFLWSSRPDRMVCALDYRYPDVAPNLADPEGWARDVVDASVTIGDTLYVMTYGHSMHGAHGEGVDDIVFPHEHPGVRAMLESVFEAADKAGLTTDFVTAREIVNELCRMNTDR